MTVFDPFWSKVTYQMTLPITPEVLANAQAISEMTYGGLAGALNEIVSQLFALTPTAENAIEVTNPIIEAQANAIALKEQDKLRDLQRQALNNLERQDGSTSKFAAILHYDNQTVKTLDKLLDQCNLPNLSAMMTAVIQQMITAQTAKIVFILPKANCDKLANVLHQKVAASSLDAVY